MEVVVDPHEAQKTYFTNLLVSCQQAKLPSGYWLSIEKRKRAPLWLPHTFKTPGTATILFTARGQHIRLLFTDDKNVDNLDKDAYLFCIGVDANKETYFKRKVGGGDKKPFVTAKQNPNAMASPLVWGDYWVRHPSLYSTCWFG